MSSYTLIIVRNRGEHRHETSSGFSDYSQLQRRLSERANDPDFVQAIVITTDSSNSGTVVSVLDKVSAQIG